MRVLFVTSWFPVPDNPNFGVFIKEHATAVQKAGADVAVIHLTTRPSDAWYKPVIQKRTEEGVTIYSKVIYTRFHRYLYQWQPFINRQFRNHYRAAIEGVFQPDLIHGHVIHPAGIAAHQLARRYDLPFHLTEHWSKLPGFFRRSLWRWAGKRAYRAASALHPVSEFLAERLRSYLPKPGRMEIVPNVVDVGLFKPPENSFAEPQTDDNRLTLLCVMGFYKRRIRDKRPELIAEAIAMLEPELQQRITVRYIGPGQQESPLREEIAAITHHAEIRFEGLKSKAEVARAMHASDLLVHPSEMETFGVVVAEALVSGLPCLVSDIPALRALAANEQYGQIVPEQTPKAWAEALAAHLKGEKTYDRAQIAHENEHRFAPKQVGARYLEAYRRTLGSNQ